jgi:hypothetical protein
MPKKSVAALISDYLKEHHVTKTMDQVLNKMRYLEDKYKDANDFLHATGEGLSTKDESEKWFILENRRMDLQKEELELRRLTLKLELEDECMVRWTNFTVTLQFSGTPLYYRAY